MDSKSHSSSKRKSSSVKALVKSKRTTSNKKEAKAEDKAPETKHSQKTRWAPQQPSSSTEPQKQVNASKEEEQKSHQHLRIKDLLENKEKIVEYLFLTVTGIALQELIPDYLKKFSTDELKALCETEIQKIPPDEILQIISDKYQPPPDEKMKSVTIDCTEAFIEKSNSLEKENTELLPSSERLPSVVQSPDTTGSFSNDILELNPSSNEMKCITDEENQAPISIEEVAKDLYASEKDAEIIELEMRARAIMSLLKAKVQESPDSESRDCCEDE